MMMIGMNVWNRFPAARDWLTREWRALSLNGADAWGRERFGDPVLIPMVAGLFAIAVLLSAGSAIDLPNSADAAVATFLIMVLGPLAMFSWWGRRRSVAYDFRDTATRAVSAARLLGQPIPEHPVWWREPSRVLRVQVALLVIGGCAMTLGSVVRDPTGMSALFAFLIPICGGGAVLKLLALRKARSEAFWHQIDLVAWKAKGEQLRAYRQLLEMEIEEASQRLQELDRWEVLRSEAGAGAVAEGVLREMDDAFRATLRAESELHDRRNRPWDVGMATLSAVLGVVIGMIVQSVFKLV